MSKMVKIIERSFEYLSKAAPSIVSQSGYLIEDDVQTNQMVLRKVVKHQNGKVSELILTSFYKVYK